MNIIKFVIHEAQSAVHVELHDSQDGVLMGELEKQSSDYGMLLNKELGCSLQYGSYL